MRILAFDTCFGAVSAAVVTPAAATAHVVERFEPMVKGHAERILPLIAQTLSDAGLTFGDLDRLAVTLGPGGFTGLRAGIAAARGLALATGLPVVGMSSLAVMALGTARRLGASIGDRPVIVVTDARRDEVYLQIFDSSCSHALGPPRLATVEQAVLALPNGPALMVGSGAGLIATRAQRVDIELALHDLQPSAADLVRAASNLEPLQAVMPNYLRDADAKVQTANILPRMAP